jgi:cytidine deaminase
VKGKTMTHDEKDLVARARKARLAAYAPYSGFRVGAALQLRDGRLFTGCNVENASLGGAICAERAALVQAVSAGARPGDLQALAVYTTAADPTPPCGMCLQCLVEFAEDLVVLLAGPRRLERTHLGALLPRPFRRYPGSGKGALPGSKVVRKRRR